MTDTNLHCFTDDCETFIATSIDDAMTARNEWYDNVGADSPDAQDREYWEQIPDDREITIWCDGDGDPTEPYSDGAAEVTKTAAEWTKRGRGFLCTTEY